MDTADEANRIPALDGVRGVAILLVLVMHSYGLGISAGAEGFFWSAAQGGWAGVDLFFVLSGYLITGILLRTRGGSGYYKTFYARRCLRIFPAYYLFLLVLLLSPWLIESLRGEGYELFVQQQPWLWTYTTNVKMALSNHVFDFGAFRPGTSIFSTAHFWSLAVEEQFYLCWPLIVSIAGPRRLGWVIGAILIGSPMLRWAALETDHVTAAYVLTPCRMDTLAMGGLVALFEWSGRIGTLARFARPGAVVSGIGIAGLAAIRGSYSHDDPAVFTFGYTLNAILFSLLVAMVVAAPASSRTARSFGIRPLRFLGKYSYGIYILHVPFAEWFGRKAIHDPDFVMRAAGSLGAWMSLAFVCIVVGSTSVAVVMWHVVEKRFLALKRYFPYPSSRTVDGRRA